MSHRHRNRHRRTNSAVEGSAAQAFLLDSISLSDVKASMLFTTGNNNNNDNTKSSSAAAHHYHPMKNHMSPIVDDVPFTFPNSDAMNNRNISTASFDQGGWQNLSTMPREVSTSNSNSNVATSTKSQVIFSDDTTKSSNLFSGILEGQDDDGFVMKDVVAEDNHNNNRMNGERFGLGGDDVSSSSIDDDVLLQKGCYKQADDVGANVVVCKEQLDRMEGAMSTMEKNLGEWRDHFDESLGKGMNSILICLCCCCCCCCCCCLDRIKL